MCKFESSQKDESRWQSTDSSKAYRNISAFKCSRNVSQVDDNINSGKAVAGFVVVAWGPLRMKQYIAQYGGM